MAAKDAEFQNSPHSPYAHSCTTESVSEFVLSIDSCDEYVPGDLVGPRNSSILTATELSGELQLASSSDEVARCDTIVSDNRAGSVGMDSEGCDFKVSAAATTTDDDSGKTDKKDGIALASSTSTSPSPPPSPLAGQKQKKPLADRFQSAVGKMLGYMRSPKPSIGGGDDNRSGSKDRSYNHSHSESIRIMNGFPPLDP